MQSVEMVMVKKLLPDAPYTLMDHDIVVVPRNQLARIPGFITVRSEVCGREWDEELIGYREAETGIVMVSYEQLEEHFS